MPIPESQQKDQSNDPSQSEAISSSETLFLLSISRDEDDAAALRSDLKRSALKNYKIQRCVHLDDANHLLQVCGFDLAFIRLDDFQDRQSAIDLIRQSDTELSIVALLSSRLLASEDFEMPNGVDTHCRLEDLSPTLVSNLVSNVLEQKRARKEQLRLNQELNFAINAGELGSWTLDIETGHVTLSESAAKQLDLATPGQCPYFDDLLERAYPEDQDRLKRLFDLAIETQGDLETNFRSARDDQPGPSIEISAKYRPGGPRANPTLYGFIKRETQTADEIQTRIEAANQAIQKALTLRDDAIQTASQELELLMQKISSIEEAKPTANKAPVPPTTTTKPALPSESSAAPAPLPQVQLPKPIPEDQPDSSAEEAEQDEQRLSIDKSQALQNVLKSITRQKKEQSSNTFPFDFSTEQQSDYTEPSPQQDGFIGAAKRLVSIT
ncbi:hypothetical protein VDG1235_4691 [Verrucomicrobiia bacterium DG1235]|nr:hypothetical protein VDG1235_4691 [Verrucomicrobiae bacterium DG1235]